MTLVLTVGGISAAHAVARARGAALIHVRTHAEHTMLATHEYLDVIDVSGATEVEDTIAHVVHSLPSPGPQAILCLHDDAVVFGARLADRLRLPFASVAAATASVDKARMREVLAGTPWDTVKHGTVSGGAVRWRTPRPTGPVVLKPGRGRASIGVQLLDSADDADRLVAEHVTTYGGYVVEERKLGPEFSVESVLTDAGAWHGVTAKHTRAAVEVGHVHPAPLGALEEATIVNTAAGVISALGVERGLLHTELILGEDGVVHVVETHLRGGGDGILDLVAHATGLDLTGRLVDDVLGLLQEPPRAEPRGYASSQFSFPDRSGTLAGWHSLDDARQRPGVVDVGTIREAGDQVDATAGSSYGRLAWAIATGPDPDSAVQRARSAVDAVRPRWDGDIQ